jgi:creatinine amidohydrolase
MSAASEVRAEYLSYLEIENRLSQASIVYIPLGAFEFHGPHLPTGLDGLTAHGVCVHAAARTGGVVLPTIFQGTGGEHSSYPWTLMIPDGESLTSNLLSILNRLEELSVQRAVVLTGHFATEQVELLTGVAETWKQDSEKKLKLSALSMGANTHAPVSPDHAGVYESLLLSALHPNLVRIEKLPSIEEFPSVDPAGNPFGMHRHDSSHVLWGIFGPDPRSLNLNDAPALLNSMIDWVVDITLSESH